jgi:hypothetical protein
MQLRNSLRCRTDAQKVVKQPVEGVVVDVGCGTVEKTSGVCCSCELGDDSSQ